MKFVIRVVSSCNLIVPFSNQLVASSKLVLSYIHNIVDFILEKGVKDKVNKKAVTSHSLVYIRLT